MTDELKPGSLLVKRTAELPEIVRAGGQVVAPGWKILPGVGARKVERELAEIRWHLFYVVDPSPREGGLGFDRDAAIRRALQKLIRRAQSQNLNALEITNISVRRFGPLFRAKVEVNFRHIGETAVLFEKRKDDIDFGQHSMTARAA